MDMKVSLINLYLPEQKMLYPPLGIMSIAAALRNKGINVQVFHEEATQRNMKDIVKKSQGVLFVGLSVLTGRTLICNLELSKLLKKNKIPVLWGGVHVSFLPESTLRDDRIDFIIMGEGEEAICIFTDKLIAAGDFGDVKGLGYKKEGKIFLNSQISLVEDLDSYKINWDDIRVPHYLYEMDGVGKFLPYLTSRGCPHRCGFCYNLNFNKRRWRGRNQNDVIEEILYLRQKYQFDGVDFIDDNFFTNQKRAFDIVGGIGVPWIAEVRADYVTEEFIKKCKTYNCHKLIIGCESGSNDLLKLINKDVTVAQIENAIRLCYGYGIKVYCSFMIMMPGESNQDREKTFDLINNLMDTYPGIEIDGPKVYTPYPGAPLFERSKENGWQEPVDIQGWAQYHRAMNPLLLKYVADQDVKKNMALVGGIAVKHHILTYIEERFRSKNIILHIFVIPFLRFYKGIVSLRLRYKFANFPLEIKLYILWLGLINKIRFSRNRNNTAR